jgi:peptide/nickel transport system substrate-binding protein
MERNPYFWGVDTEGNQLPYIDKITMTLAENTEVANLRAIAGEYDVQERHMGLAKLPVFLENAEKGGYTVHLDPAFNGSDVALHGQRAYAAIEIAKLIGTRISAIRFRWGLIAISSTRRSGWVSARLARPLLRPPRSTARQSGTEMVHARPQADNEILDKWAWTRDGEGYRLRADGKTRLRLEMITVGGQFVPYTAVGEMIKQQWKKIGVDVDIKETERNLAFGKTAKNEHQIITWANDGSEMLFLFARHALPVDTAECHMGMAYAQWYASNGTQGTKPEDPELIRAYDLFRKAFDAKPMKSAKKFGRSSSNNSGASARSVNPRRSWACASSRTTWATSQNVR